MANDREQLLDIIAVAGAELEDIARTERSEINALQERVLTVEADILKVEGKIEEELAKEGEFDYAFLSWLKYRYEGLLLLQADLEMQLDIAYSTLGAAEYELTDITI